MGYQPLVLIAEDDDVNRELITDILTEYDYRVNEAVTGKDAVEKALSEVPDLILMDIEMPVMNGLDAIKILMDNPQTNRVPIIVLTGMNETEDRIKAFDCGAMDFVAKPFNAHELLSHVRSYLRFSLLNKKYVLSTLNPDTKFPNRAAYREKLPEIETPRLFLMKIDNIGAISHFYGEGTGTGVEQFFLEFLARQQIPEFGEHATLFHIAKGLFGFLVDDKEGLITKENAREISSSLMMKLEDHQSGEKDVQYDLDLSMVICFDKTRNLEKSELALEEAAGGKADILIVDDIIQDVYSTIGENITWLKKIREAVHEDRFIPFFQPILNGETGKIEKYEALLRMIDDDGSYLTPWKFLVIAKNSKYYPDITRCITTKTMDMARHRSEKFSINISALDIENEDTINFIVDSLKREPEVAKRLIFEIVEQEGVKHLDNLKQFILQVKQLGAAIAIDDFGSGYSNFRMLMDMDVDFIKIDGSLIRHIATDEVCRNVVETITTFAEKTSIEIIAEFVENQEIQDILTEIGIRYFQGYHVGKPDLLT